MAEGSEALLTGGSGHGWLLSTANNGRGLQFLVIGDGGLSCQSPSIADDSKSALRSQFKQGIIFEIGSPNIEIIIPM